MLSFFMLYQIQRTCRYRSISKRIDANTWPDREYVLCYRLNEVLDGAVLSAKFSSCSLLLS